MRPVFSEISLLVDSLCRLGLDTWASIASKCLFDRFSGIAIAARMSILAEGAIALPVTLSGGVLFAS